MHAPQQQQAVTETDVSVCPQPQPELQSLLKVEVILAAEQPLDRLSVLAPLVVQKAVQFPQLLDQPPSAPAVGIQKVE